MIKHIILIKSYSVDRCWTWVYFVELFFAVSTKVQPPERETRYLGRYGRSGEVAVGGDATMALAARPEVAEVLRDRARRAVVSVDERSTQVGAAGLGIADVIASSTVGTLAGFGRNGDGEGGEDESEELHDE